ncbi:IclR family transcriptional regulator [Sphingomonas sp. PB4P5]|uniref:IclR family transcriptional regulator n=1 Tax=Parasphingomonas puruogangriensis TaxID=3096155 RepID=UPI002FC70A39
MADISSPHVKSATRTLDIIEFVVARDQAVTAQEISAALAIPVSSLSYLLTTLVDRGYLSRDGRLHVAGPGLDRLRARSRAFPVAERVAPLVRSLRLQLNETVSFFVQRGWEMEAIVTETSDHALRYAVQTGSRTPLHCFSAGKAMLANMPDESVEAFLATSDLPRYTAATITDAAALRREIAVIRTAGIARTREESTPGIQGVARAVAIDGETVGALAVAIPSARFNSVVEQRVAELLITTAGLLAR